MPKKAGIALVAAGAILILAALALLGYNMVTDARAGRQAETLLADVQSALDEHTPVSALGPELPVVEIDGYGYVGTLSVPTLGLELPVMSDWDYKRLKIAPCRQFGSSRTDDLVIAAHNYKTHFGLLGELSPGDPVVFTDMDGIVNHYSVAGTQVLQPTEVDAVQNSGYDLVLYTCTIGGRSRVVVFCNRTADAKVS